MSEEYFSVELPLRVQGYASIYRVVCDNEITPKFPRDSDGEYISEFDSQRSDGRKQAIKKTKVGFVYKCFEHSEDQYFVILNKEGQISPLMDEHEIIEHFKFVEAENETEKV